MEKNSLPITCIWLLLVACVAACSSGGGPRIRDGEAVAVQIVIPEDPEPGLVDAASDLAQAMALLVGVESPAEVLQGNISAASGKLLIVAEIDAGSDMGEQCYRIEKLEEDEKSLRVTSASQLGAMYGIYKLVADLGVCYHHPEETFVPDEPNARLPWHYTGETDCPDFEWRGFHEHTQHPIVASDFLLRSDQQAFGDLARHYLRWLARNRQNTLTFHMLKTVDLDSWIPYMSQLTDYARRYGIRVGVVVSFVDQQQNAFKLIPEDSGGIPEEQSIREGIDELMAAGLDFLGFQIGTSEFTKPGDAETIARLDLASAYLDSQYGADAYAWIHITCGLEDDEGGLFYHLPLQADERLGAFVHTTMFYTLEHPAPVYDCEDFSHQVDFLEQASGQRELVFFPETAWWLGFDNNMPLALPLTGWSRAHDIQQVLPDYDVAGHVTFTSGREWAYWQYDHFLTRISWDSELTWQKYLESIAPMYGKRGKDVVEALLGWSELQAGHFYEENPLIYFYLAGELPQDEIGAMAGILARRPKLAFSDLVRFTDEEFEEWQEQDFEMLEDMLSDYAALLEELPANLEKGSELQKKLYLEIYTTLWVYVKRIEHTLALYAGAAEARRWEQEVRRANAEEPPGEPDQQIYDQAKAQAEAFLADAKVICSQVSEKLEAMEDLYRYPLELLCRRKPETLTAYPYGYLYETSTAYFWTRRDEQLEVLLERIFETMQEAWETEPACLYYTDRDNIEMIEPESDLAAGAIKGFIPRMLFGINDYDVQQGTATLLVAQDANETMLPDSGTEETITLVESEGWFEGKLPVYNIVVYDSTGRQMGDLAILEPVFRLQIEGGEAGVDKLAGGELIGEVASQVLVELVVSVGGIDEEGVVALVKSVWGLPSEQDLPPKLPFAFSMAYLPAE